MKLSSLKVSPDGPTLSPDASSKLTEFSRIDLYNIVIHISLFRLQAAVVIKTRKEFKK